MVYLQLSTLDTTLPCAQYCIIFAAGLVEGLDQHADVQGLKRLGSLSVERKD